MNGLTLSILCMQYERMISESRTRRVLRIPAPVVVSLFGDVPLLCILRDVRHECDEHQ